MTENTTTGCLLFPDMLAKPMTIEFDQRQGSSDGGAVLLKAETLRGRPTRLPDPKKPFYRAIVEARMHLGRRLYFSTPAIGAILENGQGMEQ